LRAASDEVVVASAASGSLSETIRGFLDMDKPLLLLTFTGEPKTYLDGREVGVEDVLVFRFNETYSRLLSGLYAYVYGLDEEPIFPCGAILLSRRAAERVLDAGGRGFTPLIRAIRALEKRALSVRYITVKTAEDNGAKMFPISVFLFQVLLPGLLDSSLLRFMAVGLSGVLVNLGVLDAQVNLFGLYSKSYLAVPLAFECSVIWNFAFNNWFTFRAGRIKKIRFVEYNASTVGSFIVQFASVYTLTTHAHIHYLIASIIGIVLGFFVNYTISLRIWRKQ
jgi:Predicted membrane protein